MLGETLLKEFASTNNQKKITKVNDRVYHFLGYAHSNAIVIVADHSIILVDTLDSDVRAEVWKQEIKKLSDKPIKTIIYTHGHPDHQGGAGVFADSVEEIIAFSPAKPILKHYDRIQDILTKRGRFQHGYGLSDEEAICQGIGMREGKEVGEGTYSFLKPTTVYGDDVVEREIDGVHFTFLKAMGESDDQLCIWLKDDQVLCTGDNYYGCWPATYAIRGTQYRDLATWIDTLDRILSYPALALLPGHTSALIGKENVHNTILTFRNALESILFQTLDCMNDGCTMEEAVARVRLPKEYEDCNFLGEFYGTIAWTVKGVYSGYVGWFNGKAETLFPIEDQKFHHILLELIGDSNKVIEKIEECMRNDQFQEALQLLAILQTENPSDEVKRLKKIALLNRAKQVTSANARHYFIASANEIK